MGVWRYEGFDRDGNKKTGSINGNNERDVRKQLRRNGIRVRNLIAPSVLEFDIGEWLIEKGFVKPFSQNDLTHFTRQLSIMLDAGIPVMQAFEILFKSQKNLSLKKSIKKISEVISEGKGLAEAMEGQNGFGRLYCNLIRAGEKGGTLALMLKKLAEYMEKSNKIRSKIKSATRYPSFIVGIATVVVWGMLTFVVPMFVDMLEDTGQEIPLITRIVMGASEFLGTYSIIFLPLIIIIVFIMISYFRSGSGKMLYDSAMLKAPIFGNIVIKGNLGSFFRTLGTMIESGVSIIDALDICTETLDNYIIANDIKMVRRDVVKGKALNDPIKRIPYFPDIIVQMLRVGEETGELTSIIWKMSDLFEDEVEESIENMTKMVEPMIIVIIAVIFAVILVAMYLPVFLSAGGGV